MSDIVIERLHGPALDSALDDLARLRIAVFAEYPYLYEGSLDYEREYLREFAAEPGSVLIAAQDGDRVVGAATASPMAGQKAAFRAPLETAGYPAKDIFYFGESVPKARVDQAYSLVDAADALLVAGSSLTVYSGFRFVRHAAAKGMPIAIINRGPTRGDDLADVKIDNGCSPMLALLADELPALNVDRETAKELNAS